MSNLSSIKKNDSDNESYIDIELISLAERRLKEHNDEEDISFAMHLKESGLTLADLDSYEDIEIE